MEPESTKIDWRIEGSKRAESQYIECAANNWKPRDAVRKIISRYFSPQILEGDDERTE